MLFTDPVFLFCFLPLTLCASWVAPRRAKNHVLVVASIVFYASGELSFLPWLLASTLATYVVALLLDYYRGHKYARLILIAGVAIDLSLLVVFKYAQFIVESIDSGLRCVATVRIDVPTLALPLGISFFTFHKISYKVDVARGTAVVRRSPADLLLYIVLFPQLIAGPIVRYHEIAAELVERRIGLSDVASGARRFVVGLGKKTLLANPIAVFVDQVFALPASTLSSELAWLGIVAYALQIYLDFSAYSDMAIGLAKVLGFHFPENFDYPYASSSVTEFWRRWHMSLSRWFREYVYIPLGGNRLTVQRTYQNLLIVFFLCGLWHGANWTFVMWGLFHGALLIAERAVIGEVLSKCPRVLRHVYTLSCVSVGWVLFRSDTLSGAVQYLEAMFRWTGDTAADYVLSRYLDDMTCTVLVIGAVCSVPSVPLTGRWLLARASRFTIVARNIVLALIFVMSVMQVASESYNPFIYFRF